MTLCKFRQLQLLAPCAILVSWGAGSTAEYDQPSLPPVTAIAPNFYYHDVAEAKEWYVDKLGFRPVFVADWLVMVEVGPGMEIALVDGVQGSLEPVEDKGAMLTIETEALEQWFEHVSNLQGIEWFQEKGNSTTDRPARGIIEHETIEEFRVLDPGGYIIEFYRWKPEFRPPREQDVR